MPKLYTKIYHNKIGELQKYNELEEYFDTEELSCLVDKYRLMREYLYDNDLWNSFEAYHNEIMRDK